jgi:cytochrome b subunit of formate dehydrogenase
MLFFGCKNKKKFFYFFFYKNEILFKYSLFQKILIFLLFLSKYLILFRYYDYFYRHKATLDAIEKYNEIMVMMIFSAILDLIWLLIYGSVIKEKNYFFFF